MARRPRTRRRSLVTWLIHLLLLLQDHATRRGIGSGDRRQRVRLNKKLSKLIARERVCRVATVAPDGKPHLVPVCHVMNGGKIYFGSDKNARKMAKLRGNPRLAFTIDLYSEDWS